MPCICPEIWGNLLREMQAELLFRIMFRYVWVYIRGLNWSNTRDNCRAACQWADISKSDELTWLLYRRRQHGAAQYCTVHTHIRVIVIVEIIICCFFCFGAKRQSLRVLLSRYFAKNLASCMCAQRARLKLDHREKLIIFFFWFSFHFTLGSARHVMAESPPPYYN